MLVLAIDTALNACAAAVLDTDAGRPLAIETQAMARGHAEALMPLIARVMQQSGVAFDALDRIAVTTGPGSFTGLRVGISAARGIGLAAAKSVIGVTTLSAYAAPLIEGSGGPVLSVIDARHDHVYMQVVEGDGTTLVAPCLSPLADALHTSRFGAPRIVGNAAKAVADRWPADAPPPAEVLDLPAPDITWVAWLGAAAPSDAPSARPLYLRAPDAKPQVVAAAPAEPPSAS